MIETLTVAGIPPFDGLDTTSVPLKKVNYVFGTNGVGKTTLGRIIADEDAYPTCKLAWSGGAKQQTLVLNRHFIERNFGQLQGIFTLGAEQKDIQEQIEQATQALDKLQGKHRGLKRTLEGEDGAGGKRAELEKLKGDFTEKCFTAKQKHPGFGQAFKGGRNDKNKFRDMVLRQREENSATLKPLDDLKRRADKVFGEAPAAINPVPAIPATAVLGHEANPILEKKVIGKEDVDIAEMIEHLENSDWVRQGLAFYAKNDGNCPFCQQTTSATFAASLESYFDATYAADQQSIADLLRSYASDAQTIQQGMERLDGRPELDEFLDSAQLAERKAALDVLIRDNLAKIRRKKDAPSEAVSLQSLQQALAGINTLVATANKGISQHNQMVADLAGEKKRLTAEIWRFVLDELSTDLKQYDERHSALDAAINNLTKEIGELDVAIKAKRAEIGGLEEQTTSIIPAVGAINNTLKEYGFTSFRLAVAPNKRSYLLERLNGDPVEDSLSEGEKTFVVFLYFYHLVRGSFSAGGVNVDRVVVFDDPVSSLDSDVLFIVSTLIRQVCAEACAGTGRVKQVFVLTHNVYFHREVTFEGGKRVAGQQHALVRKSGGVSSVQVVDENPVSTSYQLLWNEVRRARDGADVPGIENTLRRILEYYFKILGGVKNLEKLYEDFDGDDKLVCKSLLSWVNAGSHHILDPIHVVPGNTTNEAFLRIFENIFEAQNHKAHYDMMMGV
jgi:wobble nucleotide-excising tRNase